MRKILFITIGISLLIASCNKFNDSEENNQEINNMGELTVDPTFDWKTTVEYEFTLLAKSAGIVEITNEEGKAFHKAFLKNDEEYKVKLSLPSYSKSVTLKFLNHKVDLELNSSKIKYEFVQK